MKPGSDLAMQQWTSENFRQFPQLQVYESSQMGYKPHRGQMDLENSGALQGQVGSRVPDVSIHLKCGQDQHREHHRQSVSTPRSS